MIAANLSSRTGENMKRKFLVAAIVGTLSSMCATLTMSQDSRIAAVAGDKYIISAKAGGVNFITGKVSVFRKAGTSGYLLAGDELQIGDRVTTAGDGRAEILLNPGSYMRIGGNTSFEFVSTNLEDLKINLKAGSAIFEVIAADDFRVSIKMPQSNIDLTRSGVFRIDVLADGTSRIAVFKGKAFVGTNGRTEVASGRTASLVRGSVAVSKFDRGTNDPLDVWSKDRAKELAKVNSRLERNSLRNTLLSSFNQRGWNMYNSFGLWVFDPVRRMWCFLPFGSDWGSPYGYGYGSDFWSCRMPWWIYREPYPGSGGTVGGGGGGTTIAPVNEERRVRAHTPPFQRVENSSSSSDDSVFVRRNDSGESRSGSVTSPPPAPMPPVVVPSGGEVKGKPEN